MGTAHVGFLGLSKVPAAQVKEGHGVEQVIFEAEALELGRVCAEFAAPVPTWQLQVVAPFVGSALIMSGCRQPVTANAHE